jgi:hypothetical protein
MLRKASSFKGNNIPFVEAAHYGGRQRPSAVLLKTSWTTDHAGAAYGIAMAWHNPRNEKLSFHYVVDESTVLRCVPDKLRAGATSFIYRGAVSVNVCHDPPKIPQSTTLSLAAHLTARLCTLHHIPVRILSEEERLKWTERKTRRRGGIILNTTGPFPDQAFFALVLKHIEAFDRRD